MSLSHPERVIISKGKRRSKTIKKFKSITQINSPRNRSPKSVRNIQSIVKK